MSMVKPPWTKTQVRTLNDYQAAGTMHEFTCPNNHENRRLIASHDGWRCPNCEYRQLWAHDWMLDGSWRTVRTAL